MRRQQPPTVFRDDRTRSGGPCAPDIGAPAGSRIFDSQSTAMMRGRRHRGRRGSYLYLFFGSLPFLSARTAECPVIVYRAWPREPRPLWNATGECGRRPHKEASLAPQRLGPPRLTVRAGLPSGPSSATAKGGQDVVIFLLVGPIKDGHGAWSKPRPSIRTTWNERLTGSTPITPSIDPVMSNLTSCQRSLMARNNCPSPGFEPDCNVSGPIRHVDPDLVAAEGSGVGLHQW